jgi:osmotically-inducible protein OsmY
MESNLAPANNIDLDLDLQERVTDVIYALDVLRGTRAHVEVIVSHGQVTLQGTLQSPMAAAEVARAAAEALGVAGVINHLVDDATLSSQVAKALATDARTAAIPPGYEVASMYGRVVLVGYFTSEQAPAVEAVARGVPGVRSVNVKTL